MRASRCAGHGLHPAPIRQRIESIFETCKDLLTLERHGARALHVLGTRIRCRFLAVAAAVALNYRLGPPTTRPRRLHGLNPWSYSSRLRA